MKKKMRGRWETPLLIERYGDALANLPALMIILSN